MKINILGIVGAIDFDQTKVSIVNGTETAVITGITFIDYFVGDGIYILQLDFSTSNLVEEWAVGICYQIKVELFVTPEEVEPYFLEIGTSNQCFQHIPDICFTSKIEYYNNEDAFDFYNYPTFKNVIRLPIYFKNPVVQNDQKVYVRSNGTRQKLYAKLAKKWLGLVDMATEEVHQKLVVALSHDFITFTTDNGYLLECTFEDEYNPDFPDVMQGINVWTANFNVMETPFDEVNNNCG
jgi:hypothetical protein